MFDHKRYGSTRIEITVRLGVVVKFMIELPSGDSGWEGYWPEFIISRYYAGTKNELYDAGGGVPGIASSPHRGTDLVELLKRLGSWIRTEEQAFLLEIFCLENTNPLSLHDMLAAKIPHKRMFITDYRQLE